MSVTLGLTFSILLLASVLNTHAFAGVVDTPGAHFRGMWIPRMHEETLSGPEGVSELRDILATVEEVGITDVFVQVNMHDLADVTRSRLSDIIGALDHRKVRVHAWVNLFRLGRRDKGDQLPIGRGHRDVVGNVLEVEGQLYLDPTEHASQYHVINLVTGLIDRYNVSGIQVDNVILPADAFRGKESNDGDVSKQVEQSDKWRRENILAFIRELHEHVKAHTRRTIFSVNTLGLYTYTSSCDAADLFDAYVTSGSSSWPNTSDVIGDFLAPVVTWVQDDSGNSKPMLIEPSLMSPAARPLHFDESGVPILDGELEVFSLGGHQRGRRSASTLASQVKFQLFTHTEQTEALPLEDPYTQYQWTGEASGRLYIIIHGYFSGTHKDWIRELRLSLLNVTAGSWVVVVDWGSLADSPYYPTSRGRIGIVADKLMDMLKVVFAETGMAPSQVHCIGHSLGAHTCGLAGKYFYFGRISGLDPAGPGFHVNDMSTRLAYRDATFVDVIHSDVGLGELNFGMEEPIGDVDFYPNGGSWRQPGCWKPICSHRRAPKYYAESVNDDCFDATHTCTSATSLPKKCVKNADGSPFTRMGYYSNTYNQTGIYYLQTGSGPPYCSGQSSVESPVVVIASIAAVIALLILFGS